MKTWYVRDAQGNSLAVYDNANNKSNWREQQLYGSGRLGMWRPNLNLAVANGSSVWNSYGLKFFELSNHLGNVMAVINDIVYKGKGYGKLYDTAKGAAVGAYNWTTKTTWKQKGEDLKKAGTNPHTYEAAAAVLLTHKLGKMTGPLIADDVTLAVKDFESGGTKLVSSEMLAKYPNSKTFGLANEIFVAPTNEVNSLFSQGLTRSEIAAKLGIKDPLFLQGDLIRVDVKPDMLKNLGLRPTTGGEIGANAAFVPGGKTIGGITEGVVDGIPKQAPGVTVNKVKNY
ncbi:hypothetical protein [Pedobacter chinensis]|uniref:hypothetical protein n=1 Tax=Pedobacter chinensis TaxID=2282421 RepID=UPI0011C0647F|nr:hypothetical protein [Pedobacter chinensis]